jgi:hypothetical protein
MRSRRDEVTFNRSPQELQGGAVVAALRVWGVAIAAVPAQVEAEEQAELLRLLCRCISNSLMDSL